LARAGGLKKRCLADDAVGIDGAARNGISLG
jgi:hypothetical protein